MAVLARFKLHMRMQGGSTYGHELFDDETGETIGYRSSFVSRSRKFKDSQVFTLGDQEFATAWEFLAAYEKQKIQAQRDAEWEAADPEKKGNQV